MYLRQIMTISTEFLFLLKGGNGEKALVNVTSGEKIWCKEAKCFSFILPHRLS